MNSDHAIRIKGIGKQYRLGLEQSGGMYKYKSLRDSIGNVLHAPLNTARSLLPEPLNDSNSFWALKDVSFDVKRGEVVGIIGRNGAGKSTLLKILSRITRPTTGEIELHGRVGSLLEVGTGFHPELSGRENIYLNGAVLGMTRGEVKKKFDEIVAFSEIEKFLDTPVKQYSSGMYTRLAFSVAAHLEPEILIVDEVLAVGDAEFQRKCLQKMESVAHEGRTVLFVSHNLGAISALAHRCVLLDRGRVKGSGPTAECLRQYRTHIFPDGATVRHQTNRLKWRGVLNKSSLVKMSPAEDLRLQLAFTNGRERMRKFSVDVAVENERGERVLHGRSSYVAETIALEPHQDVTVEYVFKTPYLAPGAYALVVYAENDGHPEFWADNIQCLTVRPAAYFGKVLVMDGLKAAVAPPYTLNCRYEITPEEEQVESITHP